MHVNYIISTTSKVSIVVRVSCHGLCMAINRTQMFHLLMCLSFSTPNHSVYNGTMMGSTSVFVHMIICTKEPCLVHACNVI